MTLYYVNAFVKYFSRLPDHQKANLAWHLKNGTPIFAGAMAMDWFFNEEAAC